ncbi:MAG: peptidoglycan DD-metalloendopeptidase family protein [Clostridia bacterium]|nr:peptidoglycan DD-metalloendopeptidase family protein [Clostridia bacterium]
MKKTWKIILCTALCVLTLAAVAMPIVFAAKTSANEFADNTQVQAFQATIAELEKEQAALKKQLQQVQNERYTAQQQANDLKNLILATEKKIETTQSLLDALTVQITEKEQQITEKEQEIEAKATEVADTRAKFLQLVRAQYEGESINILTVILGSDGITDMLSRVEYMASILDYNSKLLTKYKTEKQELEDMKSVLESSRNDLQADYDAQVAYMDTLEKEEAELELQKGTQDQYVATLRMSEAEIQADYDAKRKAEEEENQRLEKLLKELADANKTEYVGGKFIWPVDISIKRISSDYGWRTYYYKGRKVTDFHMGIDIPAAIGTDIYAVQDGEVILATKHSSYGNYCIVDHGGGITTLYAHCSKLLVKVGDKVQQGDHIAEMGSTGQSTGSHLHIEVRVDGKHQDPIANGWLVQPQ